MCKEIHIQINGKSYFLTARMNIPIQGFLVILAWYTDYALCKDGFLQVLDKAKTQYKYQENITKMCS